MLWTGVAFKMCDVADNFDFDYQHTDDGAVIPAMPPTLFGNEDEVERLARWLCVGAGVVKFYADSIAVKYEVSSIPPKVAPQRILDPAVRARLAKSRDGLDRFHQYSIVDFNIGSNLGLMHIVKYILADEVLGAGGYLILNVDMNIYDRLIKVFVILVMFSKASCLSCSSYTTNVELDARSAIVYMSHWVSGTTTSKHACLSIASLRTVSLPLCSTSCGLQTHST